MKNWKLWVGLGAAVLLAGAGIYAAYLWWLADPPSAAQRGALATVERRPLTASVKAVGALAARQAGASPSNSALTFGLGGKLAEMRVAEGELVTPGDVLARLDPTDLEAQVARAEAALVLARAQLARAQTAPAPAELQAGSAALAAAEARYERVKAGPLATELAAGEAALSSAQATYNELLRGPSADQRALLKANVTKAESVLQQAQAAYDKVAWQPGSQGSPQALALQRATLDTQQAQAAYNMAVAGPPFDQLQRAQAQIAQARAQLERLKVTGAGDELPSAAAQVARARADLDKLKSLPLPQDVAVAQAQAEQARLGLEQAQRQVAQANLVAPVGGTVLAVGASVGQWVAPTTSIVVLADLTALQLQVNVHESYLGQIQPGQRVLAQLEAFPGQVLEGRVGQVAALGGASFPVTIDLAPSNLPIRPGLTAQVEIITAQEGAALTVPRSALALQGGRWLVQVWRNGRAVPTEVKAGLRGGRLVQILEGLSEGDQILLHAGQ